MALAASHLFGPVLASAAEGFWLLDAPISRTKLLGPRLVGAVVAAGVGGAAIGALVSALTGSAGSKWSSGRPLPACAPPRRWRSPPPNRGWSDTG